VAKRRGGGQIVTGAEGRTQAGEARLTVPTPVDTTPTHPPPRRGRAREAAASIVG